jgi:predicted nucleic acid-binding protein
MKRAIIDTGPMVAFLCPKDQHHRWAQNAFAHLGPGSTTCEAVLAEVCHLASKEGVAQAKVLNFVARLRLKVVALSCELQAIQDLLNRYHDAPMDFADACVVRLAELNQSLNVCTVDGQFRFFRKNGKDSIPLIAPFD